MSRIDDRQWYVVYSKPQKEDYAKFQLRSKHLEVFFPRLLLPESSKRRKRIVPLFPNYLFVRLDIVSDEYHYAIWSPGVSRIISFNGSPASIDESVVRFLMSQADQDGIIAGRSNLKSGQEVRVTGGPFDGLLGIIQEPPNAKGRVKILLKLLNRDTHVDVPIHCLNGGWVASGSAAKSNAGTQRTDLIR
jgi:transcription elongation factor/antiterminator RfaH